MQGQRPKKKSERLFEVEGLKIAKSNVVPSLSLLSSASESLEMSLMVLSKGGDVA